MAKKQSECQTNAISEEVPLCDFPLSFEKEEVEIRQK
jgi:hypothetical protein